MTDPKVQAQAELEQVTINNLARLVQVAPYIITFQPTGRENGGLAEIVQIDFRDDGNPRQGMEIMAQECVQDLSDAGVEAVAIFEGYVHLKTKDAVGLCVQTFLYTNERTMGNFKQAHQTLIQKKKTWEKEITRIDGEIISTIKHMGITPARLEIRTSILYAEYATLALTLVVRLSDSVEYENLEEGIKLLKVFKANTESRDTKPQDTDVISRAFQELENKAARDFCKICFNAKDGIFKYFTI